MAVVFDRARWNLSWGKWLRTTCHLAAYRTMPTTSGGNCGRPLGLPGDVVSAFDLPTPHRVSGETADALATEPQWGAGAMPSEAMEGHGSKKNDPGVTWLSGHSGAGKRIPLSRCGSSGATNQKLTTPDQFEAHEERWRRRRPARPRVPSPVRARATVDGSGTGLGGVLRTPHSSDPH